MHSVPSRRVRKKTTLEEEVVQVADGEAAEGQETSRKNGQQLLQRLEAEWPAAASAR